MRCARSITVFLSALALTACGGADDGTVEIAVIGAEQNLTSGSLRLSEGAQLVRSATAQGLVVFDANGDVLPGLADSWIVTDDGRSYIFRLRNAQWADGSRVDGRTAATALKQAMDGLDGTSLGLDLAPVAEVRAMAGRVVELRLSSPVPNLLQVLAQPELALRRDGAGLGDMAAEQSVGEEEGDALTFAMRPPSDRGMPQDEGWEADYRAVTLRALAAETALQGFSEGRFDLVTGGRLDFWPMADPGPLSRGNVRIDPAIGLFGLQVMRADGVLADPEARSALSLALDRAALVEPFGIAGWTATARIVPPEFYTDFTVPERWSEFSLEDRQAEAGRRIAAALDGAERAQVAIYLPDGPGFDRLFVQLQAQWTPLGLDVVRAETRGGADLVLLDRVARFAGPRWFLGQFHCSLDRGLCSPEADAQVALAVAGEGELTRTQTLQQAEAIMLRDAIYIPFGAPIRWSLVRGSVTGFAPNRWAFHPLPPMATLPR